jgi:hypothetical protein
LAVNLVGRIFENLLVIRRGKKIKKHAMWLCKCLKCGNNKEYRTSQLIHRHVISCGCEKLKILNKYKFKKKLPQGASSFNVLLGRYKREASDRGLEFSISAERFKKITKQNCYLCGTPPKQKIKVQGDKNGYVYNGIDRVNNSEGYNKDNCVPCCGQCNRAKYKLTKNDFLSYIKKIYLYNFKE